MLRTWQPLKVFKLKNEYSNNIHWLWVIFYYSNFKPSACFSKKLEVWSRKENIDLKSYKNTKDQEKNYLIFLPHDSVFTKFIISQSGFRSCYLKYKISLKCLSIKFMLNNLKGKPLYFKQKISIKCPVQRLSSLTMPVPLTKW